MVSRYAATTLAVAVLALTGCTTEKDPGPVTPSPQEPPAASESGTATQAP